MNLLAKFAEVAASRLEQIAVVTERSQLSYRDLLAIMSVLDARLRDRGVKPGDRIVLDSNRAEFIIPMALLLSYLRLTVIFAPPASAAAARVSFDWLISLEQADFLPTDQQIILQSNWFVDLDKVALVDTIHSNHEPEGTFVTRTSGSTGIPKFVASSERERLHNISVGAGFFDADLKGRRFTSTLAPSSGWAISSTLSFLINGGSVLSLSDQSERLLPYIDLYRVDMIATTPAVLVRMLEMKDATSFLASVQDIRVGGAQTPFPLASRIARSTGARIHLGYGAAELGTLLGFVYDPDNPPEEGYLGTPVRSELEVGLYSENRVRLPDEASEGLIGFGIKDPNLIRSYMSGQNDSEVAGIFDGVFFPGDIVRRSGDGFAYIGRVKNIVNFSGNKVSLDLIAAELAAAYPDNQFCPLVETDKSGLETLAIAYTGPKELEQDNLSKRLRERTAILTIGRLVHLEAFPMNANGKIDRVELKKIVG